LDELQQVQGIGPEVAQSVESFFQEPRNREMITRLLSAGVRAVPIDTLSLESESSLRGKTLVFTGTISIPRAQAKEAVEAAGGKVSNSVTRHTDYLVVGDQPGSKRDKAGELGITIIGEEEFRALAGV
jgi:DNA ligase (NAD+)